MKFGIITHYDVHNHGAILQMYALIKVLKLNFGIEAKALQFDKNYDFLGKEYEAKYKLSLKSVKIYWKYLYERGLRIFLFNIRKKYIFEKFKNKAQLIGDYYTRYKDLDAVVIGSDEVFALHTGITPVLFGHAIPTSKVFSYAGCFGPTTINDIRNLHCEEFVSSGLASMVGLSMRDKNSVQIAKELTGRNSVIVVDPVILYGYKDEISNFKRTTLPPYLLVYAYENRMNDSKEVNAILEYAHSNGLKVVCPGFYHKWADFNINTDPIELLRYFQYANCVVTDTFHGCVMSIITGKNMAVKIRDNSNKLYNLLQEYGLEKRMIDDEWDLNKVFSKKQNNDFIYDELVRRRKESMDYLQIMINMQ